MPRQQEQKPDWLLALSRQAAQKSDRVSRLPGPGLVHPLEHGTGRRGAQCFAESLGSDLAPGCDEIQHLFELLVQA